jgi:hypothetical protein
MSGPGFPVATLNGIFISHESTAQCSAADFNADGVLNFFDVAAFLEAYNTQDSIADMNDDGMLNFFDVSAFLVSYGEGCP